MGRSLAVTHRLCSHSSGQVDKGFGLGPSLPLFFQMYERRCIEFDAIYGWEMTPYEGASWWKNVPTKMRSRLHFFNAAVEGAHGRARRAHGIALCHHERAHTASGSCLIASRSVPVAGAEPSMAAVRNREWAGRPASFLAVLNETAKPEDFVAIKVDIEGQLGGPELEIVRAIAELPELTRLVDEIFFEYHFWFDGLGFGWGVKDKADKLAKMGTVDDALKLMRSLREKGVRSHFWI